MDLDATLDAIDALEQLCGTCDAPLGADAPSPFWCSQECSDVWNADRAEPLVGYREPSDILQHVYNQREESDPETTPQRTWDDFRRQMLRLPLATTPSNDVLRIALLTSNPPDVGQPSAVGIEDAPSQRNLGGPQRGGTDSKF